MHYNADTMPVNKAKIASLELLIDEQRRDFDTVSRLYETTSAKNYSLIALALGLMGYLYAFQQPNTDGKSSDLMQKLFIPSEAYGIIIYAISLMLIVVAIALLIAALKSRKWSTAYEDAYDKSNMNDYETYLEYMSHRYKIALATNANSLNKKQFFVESALWPLIIGGILLLLLKTFGGNA